MVNSGSFDSDRNAKSAFIQTNNSNGSESSQSPNAAATFQQTADSDLPSVAHAIEPTPTKTEFNSTATAAVVKPVADKPDALPSSPSPPPERDLRLNVVETNAKGKMNGRASLYCSLPLEKVQSVLPIILGVGGAAVKNEDDSGECKSVKQLPPRKLLCLYCDRTFVSANLRQKHVERCHSVKQHRRVSSRRQNAVLSVTPCVYCDKLNSAEYTLKDLFQHLIADHSNKYFACLPCETRFLTSNLLADHNASTHLLPEDKQNPKAEEDQDVLPAAQPVEESEDHDKAEKEEEDEEIPIKITRSRLKSKLLDQDKLATKRGKLKDGAQQQSNKKLSVKSSKIALKRSKRLQFKSAESQAKPKRGGSRKAANTGKTAEQTSTSTKTTIEKSKSSSSSSTSSSCVNPYPEFDSFYRVKKITDHSIDNLKISSLTFDDVFDKAFFNRIKCNIQENLLHHIDGKLFKNEESESRISNFEKISSVHQENVQTNVENYGCDLSLNAVTPVASLSLTSQFGEDFESQIEYGSKPSKKKAAPRQDEVHYKYFTRRKYQASILEHKENRDLSRLDMWTQLVIKKRQQKMLDDKKSAKEMQEYTNGEEYKNKIKRDELNRILDRRGPFEDLKEEASKKAALDKLNSNSTDSSNIISEESFSEVREILNEILNQVVSDSREDLTEESQIDSPVMKIKEEISCEEREITSYLNLRRSSSLASVGEIDKSDTIALICSSQETENFELPTNTVREKDEMVELTGEWARCRMYICAACGAKLPNMKWLLEHKSVYHQNVWVQHYEFVGNQSELYRHLSIPGLGKIGVVEETVQCKSWKRSDARLCAKCSKQCNTLGELHRHILECGGDWTWMLARKKCKYRPYGAKSRRKRRGLVKRIHPQKPVTGEKKTYKKSFDGPRPRPSDADTIQRMLANLPAKRSTRKLISMKDTIYKSRKTNSINSNTNQKVMYRKAKVDKKGTINSQMMANRRSLRSINKVLSSRILDTAASLRVKRKMMQKRITRQSLLNANKAKDKASDKSKEKPLESPKESNKGRTSPKNSTPAKVEEEPKRTSPRTVEKSAEPENKKKVSVKKILTGKINMKTFFPVKKLRDREPKNNGNQVENTAKLKRKSKDPIEAPAKEPEEEEKAKTEKASKGEKNKKETFTSLVKTFSLRRNQKKVKATDSNPSDDNAGKVKNSKKLVTESKADEKKAELVSSEPEIPAKTSKKRKLASNLKRVIKRMKKSISESKDGKEDLSKTVKTTPKPETFLDEGKPELPEKTKLEQKIVTPSSTLEKNENIVDISKPADSVSDYSDSKEDAVIPETIFNLESNNEKSLQAKGELDFDKSKVTDDIVKSNFTTETVLIAATDFSPAIKLITEHTQPIENSQFANEETVDPKSAIKIDTNLSSGSESDLKSPPLVSPRSKGKIRKPNRGLNDCIAMLTNKLQQKVEETKEIEKPSPLPVMDKSNPVSVSLVDSNSKPSNSFEQRSPITYPQVEIKTPIYQKKECILKIPSFHVSKEHLSPVSDCGVLDLSKKSKDAATETPAQESSAFLSNFNSIDKIIDAVVEHSIADFVKDKTWINLNSTDKSKVVVDKACGVNEIFLEKERSYQRTSLDDTIDFVASGGGEIKNYETRYASFEEKLKKIEQENNYLLLQKNVLEFNQAMMPAFPTNYPNFPQDIMKNLMVEPLLISNLFSEVKDPVKKAVNARKSRKKAKNLELVDFNLMKPVEDLVNLNRIEEISKIPEEVNMAKNEALVDVSKNLEDFNKVSASFQDVQSNEPKDDGIVETPKEAIVEEVAQLESLEQSKLPEASADIELPLDVIIETIEEPNKETIEEQSSEKIEEEKLKDVNPVEINAEPNSEALEVSDKTESTLIPSVDVVSIETKPKAANRGKRSGRKIGQNKKRKAKPTNINKIIEVASTNLQEQETMSNQVLETNIDNVNNVKEVENKKEISTVNVNQLELSNEDEPHLLENKIIVHEIIKEVVEVVKDIQDDKEENEKEKAVLTEEKIDKIDENAEQNKVDFDSENKEEIENGKQNNLPSDSEDDMPLAALIHVESETSIKKDLETSKEDIKSIKDSPLEIVEDLVKETKPPIRRKPKSKKGRSKGGRKKSKIVPEVLEILTENTETLVSQEKNIVEEIAQIVENPEENTKLPEENLSSSLISNTSDLEENLNPNKIEITIKDPEPITDSPVKSQIKKRGRPRKSVTVTTDPPVIIKEIETEKIDSLSVEPEVAPVSDSISTEIVKDKIVTEEVVVKPVEDTQPTRRGRRKSKASKKIEDQTNEDFSLVIKKKSDGRNVVIVEGANNFEDNSNSMEKEPEIELDSTLDSLVEPMDMDIEDITSNAAIIETNLIIPATSNEEKPISEEKPIEEVLNDENLVVNQNLQLLEDEEAPVMETKSIGSAIKLKKGKRKSKKSKENIKAVILPEEDINLEDSIKVQEETVISEKPVKKNRKKKEPVSKIENEAPPVKLLELTINHKQESKIDPIDIAAKENIYNFTEDESDILDDIIIKTKKFKNNKTKPVEITSINPADSLKEESLEVNLISKKSPKRNKTEPVQESNNSPIEDSANFRHKSVRNAKSKALENILDEALAELSESERNREINTEDSDLSKKITKRSKSKENNESIKESEEVAIDIASIESNVDVDAQNEDGLRRSRRASRKITSYNENELLPPLIDEVENSKKKSKRNKSSEKVTEDISKSNENNNKQLNSDELFDLLKASTDNICMQKPKEPLPVINNDDQSSDDFNNDNFDVFEDMLDKSLDEDNSSTQMESNREKEIDKIYDFTESSPENTNIAKENEVPLRKTKKSQKKIYKRKSRKIETADNENVIGSVESEDNIGEKMDSYCEICNKSFTRIENLSKHKRTLTHISKLSEIEAREAERRAKEQNEVEGSNCIDVVDSAEDMKSDITITNILQKEPVSHSVGFTKINTNNHTTSLADIISDVLNKPVTEPPENKNNFSNILNIQSPSHNTEFKRYKSLGERKSFDSDHSTATNDLYDHSISKTTLKQISLLENIIENQNGGPVNYIDDISMSSNHSAQNSDTYSLKQDDSNLKPDQDTFIKPHQYQDEISEDLRSNVEEQKLRKTLNRDEELFLECCSLLKSGSEMSSNSKKSSNRNAKIIEKMHLKECDDEPEWLERKSVGNDLIDDYSDNSRVLTPLGDSCADDASNSNTISSNWELGQDRESEGNKSFSFEEVLQNNGLEFKNDTKTWKGISKFGSMISKNIKTQISAVGKKIRKTETAEKELEKRKQDELSDGSTCDSKKMPTKGALKIFEGLKVSIPTEELNLEEVLNNCSPRKQELSTTTATTETKTATAAPKRMSRKSKPVKNKSRSANILFKVNKKGNKDRVNCGKKPEKKTEHDVYDFEETQDNSEVFAKPDFRAFRVVKKSSAANTGGGSDVEDNDCINSSSSTSSQSNPSNKPKTDEPVTKKKCMIMGRIFKNAAAKSKTEEEIRDIPALDNDDFVEQYVLSCASNDDDEPKSKITEQEMNRLFDKLLSGDLGKESNTPPASPTVFDELPVPSPVSIPSTTSKPKEMKINSEKRKKGRKRRANSESSDDEFSLKSKKRTNRKNAKDEDNCINLEQELKECIGVASRKSQRKCTSGKQNVLVEYWSSDDSAFEALLESQKIELPQPVPEPALNTEIAMPEPVEKKIVKKPRKKPTGDVNENNSNNNRRKRAAANPLYHWSSSSEDESSDFIQVKPIRDELDDEEDRPVQHGWIVGDSPKKLVTMLAQAKGSKKIDVDSVKEQGKKRSS